MQRIKSKSCDIVDGKQRRQFSKFKVCALSQSWDIRRNVPHKITEPSMEPRFGPLTWRPLNRTYFGYLVDWFIII